MQRKPSSKCIHSQYISLKERKKSHKPFALWAQGLHHLQDDLSSPAE